MSEAAERLRSALRDAAAAHGHAPPRAWLSVGRPLVGDHDLALDLDAGARDAPAAIAWGALDAEARAAWLARVAIGGLAVNVFARARGGARGLLDRVLLLPVRAQPAAIEDLCTALFVAGLGGLRVVELEPRRNVVAVIGAKRFDAGPR